MPEMPEPQDESSVERVKKQLYVRDAQSKIHARRKLVGKRFDDVHETWGEDKLTQFPHQTPEEVQAQELAALREGRLPGSDPIVETVQHLRATRGAERQRVRKLLTERLLRTLLLASAVFFIISSVVAAYFFFFSNRQVSCENITIEMRGPTAIPSGKELIINVLITNKNAVTIKDANITFSYPEGTRNTSGSPLNFEQNMIGSLDSGEVTKHTVRAVLHGREQEERSILGTLEFAIEDSNASWECVQPFVVTLATAPISISVDALGQISSGQEMVLTIDVTANSDSVVPNSRLLVQYPYGFTYLSAEPKPSAGNGVWDLGDVKPNTRRTITVKGVVTGFETEQRTVGFELGEAHASDPALLSSVLQLVDHTFLVTRPFIQTSLLLGREDQGSGPYDVTPGSLVDGVLQWKNTLSETLYDVEMRAVLPDMMIDRKSVRTNNGFFQSEINTLVWTSQTEPNLKIVEPGREGTIIFNFQTAPFIQRTGAIDPSFPIAFEIRARRISNSIPVEEIVRGQAGREIRFVTDPTFTARSVYGIGPFTNTGPHPPTPDTETTYTVIWNLKNTINDINEAQVIGELPINVSWLNQVSTQDERITFNPVTRKVVWDLGDIVAGAGYRLPQREIAFRVAIIPSITQIGSVPPLVFGNTFTGVDSFTDTMLQRTFKEPVNTNVTGDPYFPNQSSGFVR